MLIKNLAIAAGVARSFACSSQESSSSTVVGTVDSQPFTAVNAYSWWVDGSASVAMANSSAAQDDLSRHVCQSDLDEPAGEMWLQLDLPPSLDAGTYALGQSTNFLLSWSYEGLAVGIKNSGSVTLTTVSQSEIAGSVDATIVTDLSDGGIVTDHVSGGLSAPPCPYPL